MPGRPHLLNNQREGTRHADALSYLLTDFESIHGLSIASGYVNLDGLHHLATAVSDGRKVRILLGAAPEPGLGQQQPLTRFDIALEGLRTDRDIARFPPSRAATKLMALDDWLERPDVEVRRYTSRFLHGKAYLFGSQTDARAALVTSANLTGAGLFRNLELGLVQYDPHVAHQAVAWFDQIWSEALDFKSELRKLLFPKVELLSPRDIYLKALLELIEPDDEEPSGPTPTGVELASFQLDGFHRALKILDTHHGVIYADGVGTGKTEIGLALIEEYASRRGQHALAVVPAQLVDYWKQKLHDARISAQVISYHQLASDEQLTGPDFEKPSRNLRSHKDAYRLVVMDEGHALRNPNTTWYQATARLLGGQQKDLALLTATPINNGLWDLYHLVMTFAQQDRAFEAHGIPSLRRHFLKAGANERDPENLDPDLLFSLADMVSVRRDRKFIELQYPDAFFPDGTPVSFPATNLSTERYDLDTAYPNLVQTITDHIGKLSMARYRPDAYRLNPEENGQSAVLSALLQSAILKRFESCWYACLLTIDRMIRAHDMFLTSWESGQVLSGDALREAASLDLDETALASWIEESLEFEDSEPVGEFVSDFREEVLRDRDRLAEVANTLRSLDSANGVRRIEPKLTLLLRLLEESSSQKVIIFSAFADTVRYLDKHLPSLIGGRARVTVIGSETTPDQRNQMLARFCPETVVRPDYVPPEGEVDLLISNDVLSEGQNLQQAATVISYDMPWNPQRVVQRFGRVVRLKSRHKSVSLITMLPEEGELEKILQLETAIRRKIVAAKPYGMEIEVVEGYSGEEIRNYASRLAAGDETLLNEAESDSGSGVGGGSQALSAELLRAELRRASMEGETSRIMDLPWGVGAAFRQGPDVPSKGPPGVFFACRTLDDERHWRYVNSERFASSPPELPSPNQASASPLRPLEGIASSPPEMLRRINPGQAPGVINPPVNLDKAWSLAASSILGERKQEAELAADDRSLGANQKWARALLGDADVSTPLNSSKAFAALGVERGSQIRKALGSIKRDLKDKAIDPSQAAQKIVDVVDFYGLRSVAPSPPLPQLTEEDIGVVCWMAVLPEE